MTEKSPRANTKRPSKRPACTQGSLETATVIKSKRTRKSQGANNNTERRENAWPDYFHHLYKIFKALNTVLAFVSARNHLATTFDTVRSSVESLLKEPLPLEKVAELKGLLPDLIKFAYIPKNRHRIHGNFVTRGGSPDFSIPGPARLWTEEEEHVLILGFAGKSVGRKSRNPGPSLSSNVSAKKLIQRRNERFEQAVNELIQASAEIGDPVALLQAAAKDHVPVDPSKVPPSPTRFAEARETARMPVPDSQDRQTIDAVLAEITGQEWYIKEIASRRIFDAKPGQTALLDSPLSETIEKALRDARKICSLYTHQVAAINALARGKNVIVSTSTASGKSVIYQVPVLRFLEENTNSTAMFIYPTKALAQDQKSALQELLHSCQGLENLTVATYDGDTPKELREGIRETASIIFTNFDMIHVSILPYEEVWRTFLKNLKLVVVDELHYYSGLFGSHVAQVMRRLRRVCTAVGNRRARFISCSATISNPLQHMINIFGVDDVEVITEDGAPSGRKDSIIWKAPFIDRDSPALGRHSALTEATGLMRFLMKRGVRVILFCKYRKMCELAMKTIRLELTDEGRLDVLDRVKPYRGGYSQVDRRLIEHEAFSGKLLGIIATNALELGVDIGVLDAVIMLGFPTSLASFRQQSGRAGRRARDSLSILVVESLPIDFHYVAHPDELFEGRTEDLVVDLDNKIILGSHLQCAAQEMPISLQDEFYFGPQMRKLCETQLVKDRDGWYHTHPKFLPFPAKYVSIRGSTDEEKYVAVDITRIVQVGSGFHVLEEIDLSRALFEIYEGAVYIHQGFTFVVKEVSHDSKIAKLIPADVSWITKPRDFTNVDPLETYRIRQIRGSPLLAYYGRVSVWTKVFGFLKIRGTIILDAVDLESPPWERETTGMWIDVPKHILELMHEKDMNPAEAIHAAEHAFLNRFVMAPDLRTECKVPLKEYIPEEEPRRKRPARLIFYDCIGGSGGIAAKAFDHSRDILQNACKTIEACPCEDGCAKCVQSPLCKVGNQVSSKLGARLILRGILGLEIDVDSIPMQDGGFDWSTVVEATSVRQAGNVPVETDA